MNVLTGPPSEWPDAERPASVSVGVFDGVHLGHRSLLSRLDPSHKPTVLTFEPHPVEVLVPGYRPRLLTTVDERIELFESLGIEQVGVLDLGDIRELPPERFVDDVLVAKAGAAQMVVGSDFRFGKDRAGDTELLARLGESRGFVTVVAPLLEGLGGVVSSTRIRSLIEEGRAAEAAEVMGSLFRITGPVVSGDQRGRDLGFPTVNLEPPARKVLPGDGVYAGYTVVAGERHPAAINVGVRPTFGEGVRIVEAHILDFEDDLYGRTVAIEFAHWLRPELRFDGPDTLVVQMAEDVARTRELTDA